MISKTQTLEEFYNFKFTKIPQDIHKDSGHFNVFRTEDYKDSLQEKAPYRKREFYKIR